MDTVALQDMSVVSGKHDLPPAASRRVKDFVQWSKIVKAPATRGRGHILQVLVNAVDDQPDDPIEVVADGVEDPASKRVETPCSEISLVK